MKSIEFNDKSAQQIYDNYIRRIRRTAAVLSDDDKKDVLMEFNSHIYEGILNDSNTNEVEKLLKITQDLGDPEIVLKPLVAEKKLKQATRTFNPKHIFQAIFLNIKNGFVYSIFAILYILLLGFGFLMYLKIRYPDNTGLFLKDGEFVALGMLKTNENVTEVLGNWFIPSVFFSALVLYILLTILLRVTRKKK
ncbi:DUF1700 domain-containing protein [uncultured Tenacibaculum sp.]|uniref:HAAS domain-containing protein n=1 Tax=uncultured Tenacibaculum sp. TaxID=174713 RepID=UPI0026206291|nr:DUF1700 domain-containing protein [uncultured Tenacibaculum sp.]